MNNFSIQWISKEDGEGVFSSKFFRSEEDDRLSVYANVEYPDFVSCAEKCVNAFNNLPDAVIDKICEGLIDSAKEGGIAEDFELPRLTNPRDILKYCWFVALYVGMSSEDDEVSYAVEGEGDWGENVGFFIKNDNVVYVGTEYLECLEN